MYVCVFLVVVVLYVCACCFVVAVIWGVVMSRFYSAQELLSPMISSGI